MYSEEQYRKALEIYEETKSVTQTITIGDIRRTDKLYIIELIENECFRKNGLLSVAIIQRNIPGISKIPLSNRKKAVTADALKKKYSLPVLLKK